MMTPEAFNALLKTLEEPPAHIVFILATTEPHKILPTIISRCQRFDFKRVDEHDIISRLEYVLKEENVEYDEESLEIISKLADGGMRDALSILEQCLAYDRHLTVENIKKVYGLLAKDEKIRLIKLLLTKDMKNVLKTLDHMMSLSIDLKRLTQDLIDVLKDVIIFKNTQDLSLLFVLHKNDIQQIVPYILVEEAFQMIDIFMDASSHYGQAVDSSTYFELALLKICNQIENEHKEVVVEEPKVIENVSHETLVEVQQEEVVEKPVEKIQEPVIEPQEDLQEKVEEKKIEETKAAEEKEEKVKEEKKEEEKAKAAEEEKEKDSTIISYANKKVRVTLPKDLTSFHTPAREISRYSYMEESNVLGYSLYAKDRTFTIHFSIGTDGWDSAEAASISHNKVCKDESKMYEPCTVGEYSGYKYVVSSDKSIEYHYVLDYLVDGQDVVLTIREELRDDDDTSLLEPLLLDVVHNLKIELIGE